MDDNQVAATVLRPIENMSKVFFDDSYVKLNSQEPLPWKRKSSFEGRSVVVMRKYAKSTNLCLDVVIEPALLASVYWFLFIMVCADEMYPVSR